jgi:hypothetical protein
MVSDLFFYQLGLVVVDVNRAANSDERTRSMIDP